MKKSLIFIVILAIAQALFAEDETVSCESDLGQCTYTLSAEFFSGTCVCRDGSASGEDGTAAEDGTLDFTLPTEEECKAELESVCKDAGFTCENEAGHCDMDQDGKYSCVCFGVAGGRKSGESENSSAEGCIAALEKECGTVAATPKMLCTDEDILNECIYYEQIFADTCFEPLADEEIAAILETPVTEETGISYDIAGCCQNGGYRELYKSKSECIEAAGNCENKECCATCEIELGYKSYDEGSEDEGNDVVTPAPEEGNMGPGGDVEEPTDDADTPAENKEESKSDGCSMLFI